MKILIASLAAATTAAFAIPALTASALSEVRQEDVHQKTGGTQDDADKLFAGIKQARAELREMRIQAGLHAHATGAHIDPEGHHEGEKSADRERERGERDGHEDGAEGKSGHEEGGERGHREGGERGHDEGKRESSKGNSKLAKFAKTYENGAMLTLQYNPATQAFVGSVKNTTEKPLSQVRVEIHLSNGMELGPTMRTDLKAGGTLPVELSALDQTFTHWVTHPEAGNEEEHASGDEESERHGGRETGGEHGRGERSEGEHGGGSAKPDVRPESGKMRAVHNELLLLRGEMRAFDADLKAMKK